MSDSNGKHDEKASAGPPSVTNPARQCRAKGGAPAGNRNAVRHGIHSSSDPEPYLTRLVTAFRRNVEEAVIAALGSITVAAASEIQAASEWESHRLKCKRWLRMGRRRRKGNEDKAEALTLEQKLTLSREAARAASERTKHLKALCVGSPAKRSLWATLDAVARDADEEAAA